MRRMNYVQKFEEAKKRRIYLPPELLDRTAIVCVYGFFAAKGAEKICFYIGKTTNLKSRLLDACHGGHVYYYLIGKFKTEKSEMLVPTQIEQYLRQDYDVSVEILENVNYDDTNFSRAAHRLALAEMEWIVKYQKQDQCLKQLPEGIGWSGNEHRNWDRNYNLNNKEKHTYSN